MKKGNKSENKRERGRGRPSRKTPEVCEEIVRRLGGGEPLAQICRGADMPCVQTVADWAKRDEAFSVSIARARDDGADALAAECLEIAAVATPETVQVARLQIETRLKLLSKWSPKKYGDKIDVAATHTGTIRVVIGGEEGGR